MQEQRKTILKDYKSDHNKSDTTTTTTTTTRSHNKTSETILSLFQSSSASCSCFCSYTKYTMKKDSKLWLHNNTGKSGNNAQTKCCQQAMSTEETETLGPLWILGEDNLLNRPNAIVSTQIKRSHWCSVCTGQGSGYPLVSIPMRYRPVPREPLLPLDLLQCRTEHTSNNGLKLILDVRALQKTFYITELNYVPLLLRLSCKHVQDEYFKINRLKGK